MSAPYLNYLAGVGYASVFGFSFLVTKDALLALDPFELLFLRFAIAALLMSILALTGILPLRGRRRAAGMVPTDGSPGGAGVELRRPASAWRDLALCCLFQPLLYFVAETFGVRESASSTAGIVLGALPAAVAILSVFMLGERLAAAQYAALGLSVAGVAVVVLLGGGGGTGGGSPRGLLLLFGAVASAAFFNIYSRRSSRWFSTAERTMAMMWTGAVVFGLVTLLRGPAPGASGGLAGRMAGAIGGVLYLGVLASVGGFFMVNYTLGKLPASLSVVFANLTTVISVAAGVLVRGESFGFARAAGALMIILGVWGTNALGGRADREQASE